MTMLDHKLNPIILLLLTSYSRSAALPLSISLPFCLTVIIDCHQTKPTKTLKINSNSLKLNSEPKKTNVKADHVADLSFLFHSRLKEFCCQVAYKMPNAQVTRCSAVAEEPRDALCTLKSCSVLYNCTNERQELIRR